MEGRICHDMRIIVKQNPILVQRAIFRRSAAILVPLVLIVGLATDSLEAQIASPSRLARGNVALSELDLTLLDQDWSTAKRDRSVTGKPLNIDGETFAHGIGTHSNSLLILWLDRGARRFQAKFGVDDGAGSSASVRFSVHGDGRELWNSGIRRKGQTPLGVNLDVSYVRYLSLRVEDAGDGIGGDHADWIEPTLTGVTRPPVVVSRLPGEEGRILPGRQWVDTEGNLIQAHGGGILRYNSLYYWYGEDRSNGYVVIGVSGYESDNLVRWKPLGVVLPRSAYDQKHGAQNINERPKVIFNPKTRKFVMWFHYDKSGYGDSKGGVAVADRPEGPFRYLGQHRPVEKSTFRDMNLFVDDDGEAYVFYSGEDNGTMHIVRLNDEWTAEEKPMVEGKTWARAFVGKWREAPAPFKHGGIYYVITSGCTGWAPNAADLAVAKHPLGPWKMLGNPFSGKRAGRTFDSQSTFVFPQPGAPPGSFIYMGDRWKSEALADSRYIWLPFKMTGARTRIEWKDYGTFKGMGKK